jgi:PAS domain-containing protein
MSDDGNIITIQLSELKCLRAERDRLRELWLASGEPGDLVEWKISALRAEAERDRLQKDNDKLRIEHTELFETYAQQGLTAFKAVEEERTENERLREALEKIAAGDFTMTDDGVRLSQRIAGPFAKIALAALAKEAGK